MTDTLHFDVKRETAVLRATTRTGLAKYWQGRVVTDQYGNHYLQTLWWQDLASGAQSVVQTSTPALVEPKNIGKANETTPEWQADSELASLVKTQRDKRYRGLTESDHADDVESGAAAVLPMLAEVYLEEIDSIQWPAFAQPKFDGCRCLYDGTTFTSRKGIPFIADVVAHLHFPTRGFTLDGELMLPRHLVPEGANWFQTTMSAIKKFDPERTPFLEYHVYDVVIDKGFERRTVVVENVLDAARESGRLPAVVHTVETRLVWNDADVLARHATFVSEGWEGTMVRQEGHGYEVNHRSAQLLKLKDFHDAEFEIVGVVDGKGKEKGLAIFKCATPNGETFKARPRGSNEQRAAWFTLRVSLIGERLTVRYQELTKTGKPRFPVGIAIREEFDR